jgi:hypothetical protein
MTAGFWQKCAGGLVHISACRGCYRKTVERK